MKARREGDRSEDATGDDAEVGVGSGVSMPWLAKMRGTCSLGEGERTLSRSGDRLYEMLLFLTGVLPGAGDSGLIDLLPPKGAGDGDAYAEGEALSVRDLRPAKRGDGVGEGLGRDWAARA
jgi:hypothetical protein